MAIRLYSGIPGSGKTYRVVYELKYTDLLRKYYIFHNIPNLKIEHPHLKHYGPESDFNPSGLFTYETQKEISAQIKEQYNKNVLWIIDECDKLGMDRVDKKHKEWLSMHRHLGQEIYLITQSRFNIAKDYMNLIEVEIQGKRGYIFQSFIYSWLASGEKFATDRIPKKKDVFEAYRSFHFAELKNKKSKIFIYLIGLIFITLAALVYFFFFSLPGGFKETSGKMKNQSQNQAHTQHNETNSSMFQSQSLTSDNIGKYYFAGSFKKIIYMTDSSGNLYNYSVLNNKDFKIYEIDRIKKSAILLEDEVKTISATYIQQKQIAGAGGGRAPASPRDSAPVTMREYWINVEN